MSVLIVFICHDDESVEHVIHYGYPILFVGDKETLYRDKVILVRELPDHIEHLPKLLTFTAWYAIVKNKLFLGYDHLCLLEWDVILKDDFELLLQEKCNEGHEVISFYEAGIGDLLGGIHTTVLFKYLKEKGCQLNDIYSIKKWGVQSNQCLRRSLLNDFVEWYYPSCIMILELDPALTSWYHERIFMIYLNHRSIEYTAYRILDHLSRNSHREINQS
jgi:hypothetical protein